MLHWFFFFFFCGWAPGFALTLHITDVFSFRCLCLIIIWFQTGYWTGFLVLFHMSVTFWIPVMMVIVKHVWRRKRRTRDLAGWRRSQKCPRHRKRTSLPAKRCLESSAFIFLSCGRLGETFLHELGSSSLSESDGWADPPGCSGAAPVSQTTECNSAALHLHPMQERPGQYSGKACF